MNYQELENKIVTNIENQEYDLYFQVLKTLILQSHTFGQLIQPLILFINLENKYKIHLNKDLGDSYRELFLAIQNQFVEIGEDISPRNKPSRDIFYVYKISSQLVNIPKNHVIDSNIKELSEEYSKMTYEGETQLFIHDILFVLEILNGEKEALKNYLKRTFTLHVQNLEQGYSEFVKKILVVFDVKMELILEVFQDLFKKENYFSLLPWQRRSLYNWILHVLAQLITYHNNPLWYKLYEQWIELIEIHIEKDQADEVMYINFFILHLMGNLFQEQEEFKEFNQKINKPVSEYLQKWGRENSLGGSKKDISKNGKIKIAFVEVRLVKSSPYFVLRSFLKYIAQSQEFMSKYVITIYSANYIEKSPDSIECINEIKNLGFEVKNPNEYIFQKDGFYHSHLEKALNLREAIITDSTDIMVTYNDYDIFNFLFSNRSAPKQIYWTHGNHQYDVENIDLKITHSEKIDGYNKFSIPLDLEHYNPKVDQNIIKDIKKRFSKDTIVLGSIGRLVKIDSKPFLEAIAEVMKRDKNIVFLACGAGSQVSIIDSVKKLGVSDRFFFEGHIDANVYNYVIDILCCPFPLGGGEVYGEYELKDNNGATVFLENKDDLFFFDKNDSNSLTFEYNTSKKYKNMIIQLSQVLFEDTTIIELDKEKIHTARNKILKKKFDINVSDLEENTVFGNSKRAYVNRIELLVKNNSLRKYYSEYRKMSRVEWNNIILKEPLEIFE